MIQRLYGRRCVATILAVATAIACSCGTPTSTSPSSTPPPLADRTFILSLLGDSLACQDIKNPQAGTNVNVLLDATHDATGTWIGSAASTAGGDVQVRLMRSGTPATAPSGPPHPTDFFVAGTMSGTATDSYVFGPGEALSGTSALLGNSVSISGIIRIPSGTFGDGYNDSALTFARNGVSSICPAGGVGWTLNGPM